MTLNPNVKKIIDSITEIRISKGLTQEDLEDQLNLGKGWISAIEEGTLYPPFDLILSLIELLNIDFNSLTTGIEFEKGQSLNRLVSAIEDGNNLKLYFQYNNFNATYKIPDATLIEFTALLHQFQVDLRNPKVGKSKSIIRLFFNTVRMWKNFNPSDIWYFFILRMYMDRYNHSGKDIHTDLGQSWKRASGWALEEIFVEFYRNELLKHGIVIGIFKDDEKTALLRKLKLNYHVEANKADVLLVNIKNGVYDCFGVAHIKASIAERRQNDQNFSQALLNKNYFSPLLTMDCKAVPSAKPYNRGEFGVGYDESLDERNDKRKEFEEEGYFSGCFSFNFNTIPTPQGQRATSRIYRMTFDDPNDEFISMTTRKRDQLYR